MLTAEEVARMAPKGLSPAEIASRVDVVTTATFGAMCSLGLLYQFRPSEPGFARMESITLDRCRFLAAWQRWTRISGQLRVAPDEIPEYGGGHLIRSAGARPLELEAQGRARTAIRESIFRPASARTGQRDYHGQPRNAYQITRLRPIPGSVAMYTYGPGDASARFGNVTYSTSGELSPLLNDPDLRTIGIGTRVFSGRERRFCQLEWDAQLNTEKPGNEVRSPC